MATVLDPRHFQPTAHHRLWLIIEGLIAFVLAALWAQPIG